MASPSTASSTTAKSEDGHSDDEDDREKRKQDLDELLGYPSTMKRNVPDGEVSTLGA